MKPSQILSKSVILVVALVCAFVALRLQAAQDAPGTVEARWNSAPRGSVVFVSDRMEYLPNPGLYLLDLRRRFVRCLRGSVPSIIEGAALGALPDSETVFFADGIRPETSIAKLSLRDPAHISNVLRNWSPPTETVWVKDSDGIRVAYSLPNIQIVDRLLCFGSKTGALYSLRWYCANLGPPGYNINVDTLNVPRWCGDRIESALQVYRTNESMLARPYFREDTAWYDIIQWGDNGDPVWSHPTGAPRRAGLTGFTVSPDERQFAYSDGRRVWVYDRRSDSTVAIELSPSVRLVCPAFSPDGVYLAAISKEDGHPSRLLLYDAQVHTFVRELRRFTDILVVDLLWLPDSDWIVAHARLPGKKITPEDLVAIEVSTGEMVEISRPYRSERGPEPAIYVDGHPVWVKAEWPDST